MAGTRRSVRRRQHRARWAVAAVVVALVVAGVVAILLIDDSDERADPPTTTASSTLATTSSSTTTTTTTTGVTTTTTAATTTTAPAVTDPEGAARALFGAWQAGDRAAAARVASASAVDQMFSSPYAPGPGGTNPWSFQSCGAAAGSLYCTWTTSGGAQIRMQVRTATGGLPVQVIDVQRN